jgi:hypothetical protein
METYTLSVHRILAAALVLTSAPAFASQVSATHALVKIRPTDSPATDASAWIGAAANEMESFQVVVAGGASGLSGVSASMGDLTGPSGKVPASEVVLYREAYMNVQHLSDGNSMKGRVPDALIPDVDPYAHEKRNAFPFNVPAGENRVLLVDVHVPKGTKAGNYAGSLTVNAAGGFQEKLPVQLEVFPFELSSTPTYRTAYGMSWSQACSAHTGSPNCNGDHALQARLQQLYGMAGLDDRISISGVAFEPPPGSGAGIDFSSYDALMSPLLDGKAATRLKGAMLTATEVYQSHPTADDYRAWAQHFRARGWMDRLFDYSCDEPPGGCSWDQLKKRIDLLHSADRDLKSLATTSWDHVEQHGLQGLDIVVPVVNFVEGKPGGSHAGDNSPAYRAFEENGGTAWMYASCMSHGCGQSVDGEYAGDPDLAGWPSQMIDHTAIRNRALPWVAASKGFTGELYFAVAYAFGKRDPWQSQWDFTGNGDGTLFYPGTPAKIGGKTDIPVDSLRMKEIRDGIEDFEYLTELAKLEGEASARSAASSLMPHAWSAGDVKPETLLEARRQIASRIAQHVAPGQVDGSTGWRPGAPPAGSQIAGLGAAGQGGCAAGGGSVAMSGLLISAFALAKLRRRRA